MPTRPVARCFALPPLPSNLTSALGAVSIATLLTCPYLSPAATPANATGITNGVLTICSPPRVSCISSQDDIPISFLEPFEYDTQESRSTVQLRLKDVILLEKGASLKEQRTDYKNGTYMRFEVELSFNNYDDIELFFPTDDNIIHFKSENRNHSKFDAWRNRNRINSIKRKAALDSVPVLRGRSSIFGIFESPFDSFGPTVTDVDAVIEKGGISSRPSR